LEIGPPFAPFLPNCAALLSLVLIAFSWRVSRLKVIDKRCSVRVDAKTGLLNKLGRFCQLENRISRLHENEQNNLIS
jgi:hypothetical protein